ncbi:MAG: glycosyltransferase [Chloroflexi bacterium]|nr:glycosyltransferase [Chloroflexota bacterium]
MRKKIKIVYIIGQLGLGGSERQLFLLLKHLDQERFEAIIIVFNPSAYVTLDNAMRHLGYQVFAVPQNYRRVIQRLIYIYKLLCQIRPDIVHSWTIHDNPYAGIAGLLAGVTIRWGSVRDSIFAKGFDDLPTCYKWLSLNVVNKLVVNAESIYKELLDKGVIPSKISVLPNCVETSTGANPELTLLDLSGFGIPVKKALVGLVGNLRKKKNHLMFIESMAQVIREYPDTYGIIIGQSIPDEMEYYQILRRKLSEPELARRVFLMGFRNDVVELMERITIFCMTSDYEGTPNAILEAMAASKPVVATRVGGIPYIVEDNVSGFLVEPGDARQMAKAISKLLQDPLLANDMGRAGRKFVETRFSCEQVITQLQEMYLEAVNVNR